MNKLADVFKKDSQQNVSTRKVSVFKGRCFNLPTFKKKGNKSSKSTILRKENMKT